MKIFEVICGLGIIVGSGAGWHCWHLEPLVALLLGSVGVVLIYHAFNVEIGGDL